MIFKFVILILLSWYPQNKRRIEVDQFHFLNPRYSPYNTELKETIGKLFYPHLQRHNPVITKDYFYFEHSRAYDQVGNTVEIKGNQAKFCFSSKVHYLIFRSNHLRVVTNSKYYPIRQFNNETRPPAESKPERPDIKIEGNCFTIPFNYLCNRLDVFKVGFEITVKRSMFWYELDMFQFICDIVPAIRLNRRVSHYDPDKNPEGFKKAEIRNWNYWE